MLASFLTVLIISSKLFTTSHLHCPCIPLWFHPRLLFSSSLVFLQPQWDAQLWNTWPLLALTSLQSHDCYFLSLSKRVQGIKIWTVKSNVLVKGLVLTLTRCMTMGASPSPWHSQSISKMKIKFSPASERCDEG